MPYSFHEKLTCRHSLMSGPQRFAIRVAEKIRSGYGFNRNKAPLMFRLQDMSQLPVIERTPCAYYIVVNQLSLFNV